MKLVFQENMSDPNVWTLVQITLAELVAEFRQAEHSPCTGRSWEEIQKLSIEQREALCTSVKNSQQCVIPAVFKDIEESKVSAKGSYRLDDNVFRSSALFMDLDALKSTDELHEMVQRLRAKNVRFGLVGSLSHMVYGTPKIRIIFELSDPEGIPPHRYSVLWNTVNNLFQLNADAKCKNVSHFYFMPGRLTVDSPWICDYYEGEPIDLVVNLAKIADSVAPVATAPSSPKKSCAVPVPLEVPSFVREAPRLTVDPYPVWVKHARSDCLRRSTSGIPCAEALAVLGEQVDGVPLAREGGRDSTLASLAMFASNYWPEAPVEYVLTFAEKGLAAMDALGLADAGKSWRDVFQEKLSREAVASVRNDKCAEKVAVAGYEEAVKQFLASKNKAELEQESIEIAENRRLVLELLDKFFPMACEMSSAEDWNALFQVIRAARKNETVFSAVLPTIAKRVGMAASALRKFAREQAEKEEANIEGSEEGGLGWSGVVNAIIDKLIEGSYQYRGGSWENISLENLENRLAVEGFNRNWPPGVWKPILNLRIAEECERYWTARRDALSFVPGGETELQRFILAILPPNTPEDEIACHYAAMWHFIWCVKRKMHGLPVGNHLFISFLGPQGSGKSSFIWKFLAPLQQLVIPASSNVFEDDFGMKVFGRYAVLFMDELEKMDRVSIKAIKNIITSDGVHKRRMHSQHHDDIKNRASMIGASNLSLSTLIQDSTGMRRFWEIPTNRGGPRVWKITNEIDFWAIWRGVDHLQESIWKSAELVKTITKKQAELTVATALEEFLADYCKLPEENEKDPFKKPASEVWQSFCSWNTCRKDALLLHYKTAPSFIQFSRMISDKNLPYKVVGKKRFYSLTPAWKPSTSGPKADQDAGIDFSLLTEAEEAAAEGAAETAAETGEVH